MKKLLVIPDFKNIDDSIRLARGYDAGFEYNDFNFAKSLDDEAFCEKTVNEYKSYKLPDYTTNHGAFIDVLPYSTDKKIKEISIHRINQSIKITRKIGAKSVVFHLNYNPYLNHELYVKIFPKLNIDVWRPIIEENPDINIYIENMFEQDPYIIKKVAKALSEYDNFGLCLDWSHAVLSKTNPQIWAEELKEYVKHIHLNDNDLKVDTHLAWGSGQINRNQFYNCYDRYLSDATILIETVDIPDQRASLRQLEEDGFIK
jgi:endonuclease IV